MAVLYAAADFSLHKKALFVFFYKRANKEKIECTNSLFFNEITDMWTETKLEQGGILNVAGGPA